MKRDCSGSRRLGLFELVEKRWVKFFVFGIGFGKGERLEITTQASTVKDKATTPDHVFRLKKKAKEKEKSHLKLKKKR